MKNLINSLLVSFLFLFTACSSLSLQSSRLDTAESYITQAEQTLANSPSSTQTRAADEDIGTAHAYLATLNDQKKFLTKNELKRYQALKQRADRLLKRIR